MKRKLLICGAFDGELSPFHSLLVEERCIVVKEIGIGVVEAALQTTQALNDICKEDTECVGVIFVGSVGSVGSVSKSVELFSLVSAKSVSLADYLLIKGDAYLPEGTVTTIVSSEALQGVILKFLPISSGAIYSTLAITGSEQAAKTLSEGASAPFENLELFGVASACHHLGIPWTGLCAVTNTVSAEGHLQWKKNHKQAAELTAKRFLQMLPELKTALHLS